jgi:hypothetical protein
VRIWSYVLSCAAIPVVLAGSVLLALSAADAYMVVFGGAKPGDEIFLDTRASPLQESVADMGLGAAFVVVGLCVRAYARRLRRAAS